LDYLRIENISIINLLGDVSMSTTKNKVFQEPVVEIIKKRISVRNYEQKPLAEDIKKKLSAYLEGTKGPFNAKIRFKLVDSSIAANSKIKLGTYGIIRGASSFTASAVEKGDMYLEELGYELESFILYATSLGLGTCWMGGTFKKGEFAKALGLKENELLPIVTPVGCPAKNKGIVGSLMRTLAGSDNRKAWEELFFNGSFDNRLTKEEAGQYVEALEMVRLAPSASNKQPWRIVKDGSKFHFYINHAKGYSSTLGFDMQKIDMGIAMCHFEFTLREAGIEGNWENNKPNIKLPGENVEYIVSWIK
jgi:nitroreductase